ncbi:MAG: RlmE family RNA methyltransferase [Deltaproteobacteria bacterium]|nr:MAG: RlmE family RNA methyltransferase [Deltaproteobacteria bacterium]
MPQRPAERVAPTPYDRRDSFHQRAKREGFRSRAAYKLLEIQKARRILRRGMTVVDLGCWPGGWLQVASQAVGPTGRVIGVDVAAIDPPLDLANVFSLSLDFTEPAVSEAILECAGRRADVLLCDAAPKLSGVRATDRANEEALLEAVDGLLPKLLEPGGTLLVKLLESPEAEAIARRWKQQFEHAKTVKTSATRKGSSERYLLARGYRGPEAR